MTTVRQAREAPSLYYRRDIDGLRAFAVLAVIAFHLGWLPYGYLGVDVFFVISGFLITGICLREAEVGTFSLAKFWMRRIRRILPLVSVVVAAALGVGVLTMLPDDLENLCQSVIATNIFANNVLQAITTRNYWDVVNEYKPLMHTWSLGIEEQYYLVYPLITWLLIKRRTRLFVTALSVVAAVSLGLFFAENEEYRRFYWLQYRFFELAAGGLLAVAMKDDRPRLPMGGLSLFALLALLFVVADLPPTLRLLLVVGATMLLLASENTSARWHGWLLTNRAIVFVGLISFSLYMWHQAVFAFTRYLFAPISSGTVATLVVASCFAMSWVSWRYIERPFRNPAVTSTGFVLVFVICMTTLSTAVAGAIYLRAGVVRDVPELDITIDSAQRGMHSAYNHRIHALNQPFDSDAKTKVLVIGNSFARDWANILLESAHAQGLSVSYRPSIDDETLRRAGVADLIYVNVSPNDASPLPSDRTWFIGTKSFGTSNGIYYNHPRVADYCLQRASPEEHVVRANERAKLEVGERLVDLLSRVLDDNGTVPVFTPDCRFISQDTRHLTRAGAAYFAVLMSDEIEAHLDRAR